MQQYKLTVRPNEILTEDEVRAVIRQQDELIGELTRKKNVLQDSENRRTDWIDRARRDAGYPDNISFDVVWADTLSLAKKYKASMNPLRHGRTMSAMTIDQAINIARKEVTDGYAQAYLQALPEAIDVGGTRGFEVQLMYALNNMRSWRGENARAAKLAIKNFLKRKS